MLHVASVIGREFSRRVLERIVLDVDAGGSIDDRVHALIAADLIQKGRVWPEMAYLFKHALTQDVAYQDLREPQRQALHARIGEAIESLYADRLSELRGVLAYHFTRARQWAKALDYLLAAAHRAEHSDARGARSVRRRQVGGRAAGRRRCGRRDAHHYPRGESPALFRQKRFRAVGRRTSSRV